MEIGRGGDDRITGGGIAALPIGNFCARSANDWDEGHDVPRAHLRVEHYVCVSSREEIVAVAIAPSTCEASCRNQFCEGVAILVAGDVGLIGRKENRVFKLAVRGGFDDPAIDRGCLAVAADTFAESREINAAEYWFPLLHKGDHSSEERAAGGVCFSAVDRVDDPGKSRVRVDVRVLFALDTVIGKYNLNRFADLAFGFSVGKSNRRFITLQLDFQIWIFVERKNDFLRLGR